MRSARQQIGMVHTQRLQPVLDVEGPIVQLDEAAIVAKQDDTAFEFRTPKAGIVRLLRQRSAYGMIGLHALLPSRPRTPHNVARGGCR